MSAPSAKWIRLSAWIDSRFPVITFLREQVVEYQTPRNLSYLWNFGSLAVLALGIMVLTGIFLAMHYTPTVDGAFASVQHIMRNVNYGWLIRFMHINGASFLFIIVYVHTLRGLYYGSYKPPREILWLLGVVLLVLLMMTAFMGYVLPWGQLSYWGATVITNLFSAVPLVGDDLVAFLWGGYHVAEPTLGRFFALHFLFPFLIIGVVGLHLVALRKVKSGNPLGIEPQSERDTLPFHPYYTVKDLYGFSVFLTLYAFFIFFASEIFITVENAVPANPLATPPHIAPEWYFLPYYAILRAVPDKLLGVLLMFSAVFVLALVPWLDRHPVRSARFRPLYKQFFWLFVVNLFVLGWCGSKPPEGIYITIARAGAAYHYAFFFLIMPLLSRFERTRPLPASIAEETVTIHHRGAP